MHDLLFENMYHIYHVVLIHLGMFSKLHKMQQEKILKTMNQQMLETKTKLFFYLKELSEKYLPPTVFVSHASNNIVSL